MASLIDMRRTLIAWSVRLSGLWSAHTAHFSAFIIFILQRSLTAVPNRL